MNTLLEQMPAGIVVLQGEEPFRILYVNQEFKQMTGCGAQEILPGGTAKSRVHPEDLDLIRVAFRQAKKNGKSGEYEFRILEAEGNYHWYILHINHRTDSDGKDKYVMMVIDIHERKQVELEMQVQRELHWLTEQVTGDFYFDVDVESGDILITGKYLSMRGEKGALDRYAKQEEMEKNIFQRDLSVFRRMLEEASQGEQKGIVEFRLNVSPMPEEEEYEWYRLTYKSIAEGEGGRITRIVGRMNSIQEEKREQSQLSEQIKRDSMTGLYNKGAAQDEVECFLEDGDAQNQTHALLVIDIDNFKDINDNFGHLFGDTVLVDVAEKISGIFPKSDLVARIGGDEFLVFVKNTNEQDVMAQAEKICDHLREEYYGQNRSIKVSSSVGAAIFPQNGRTFIELCENADYAMYQAKNEGKDRYRMAGEGGKMPESYSRTRQEGRKGMEPVRRQDENLLATAFSLLSHARDLNGSLNLLLERVAKRYGLDAVVVIEDKGERDRVMMTNCWQSQGGVLKEGILIPRRFDMDRQFDDQGMMCMDRCPPGAIGSDIGLDIKSLISCKYHNPGGSAGMVNFVHAGDYQKWSEFEKSTFYEITKTIAVFVSLKRSQEEHEKALLALQHRDPLTGIYNEAYFKKVARQRLGDRMPGCQYALVFSDINDFSYVNENFGMEAGNKILREFASKITAMDRVVACRVYSDLFISLVCDTDRERIQQVVEQANMEFEKIQRSKYPGSNLSLIAGIYFIEHEDEDIDVAIENANLTRKKLKQGNKGMRTMVYHPWLRQRREKEVQIASRFSGALEEGQFQVYIQPKFILKTGEICGGEALVRWIREDGTMVYPDEFIPVLEKYGYIVMLDFHVLEQLLKRMQTWKQEGKQLYRISVNFSRKHFEVSGISQRIRSLVEKYGIDSRYIEIEITESMLESGVDIMRKEMELLRESGFKVSIDDFGTGYSSLSMLRDMQADVVKIDKSFMDKSGTLKEQEFIKRMGGLVQSLKEEVIFEGIETEKQLQFLIQDGFQYGQGYICDKPLPMEVFEEKYMK